MAVPRINVASMTPGTAPKVLTGVYATGQTFLAGAPLQYSSGELVECTNAADVATGIVGFSGVPVATGLGADAANSPVITVTSAPNYKEGPNVVQFYTASENKFLGAFYNGTDPAEPDNDNLGVSYGLVKLSDGTWVVNEADTTNDAVRITQVFPSQLNRPAFVEFEVLASIQLS